MTRLRASGTPPRADVEHSLQRSFWLPTARTFSLTGQARISPLVPDDEIDRLVGRPGSDYTGTVAYSQGRLPNDLRANAIVTLDGAPSTIWEPGFGSAHQAGEWLQYHFAEPVTFDHLDLQVVADGQHSVPTRVTVTTGSGSATVALPPLADSQVAGAVVDVRLALPSLHGRDVRLTFDTVRTQDTLDYYSQTPIALPIGIAEVGIPGAPAAAPVPTDVPTSCRSDLLSVDGAPVWVQVSGTTADALDRKPLTVSLCGPDAGGLAPLHVLPGRDACFRCVWRFPLLPARAVPHAAARHGRQFLLQHRTRAGLDRTLRRGRGRRSRHGDADHFLCGIRAAARSAAHTPDRRNPQRNTG